MCLVGVILKNQSFYRLTMLRRRDSNPRPLGYEPSELPAAPLRCVIHVQNLRPWFLTLGQRKSRYPHGQRLKNENLFKKLLLTMSF